MEPPISLKQHSRTGSLEFARAIVDGEIAALLDYKQLSKHPKYENMQQHSYRNEIGKLAQGMPGKVKGMNTIFVINKQKVPQNRYKDVHMAALSVIIERKK